MGKSIKKWMCYTNPFTDPETWAGFEVSHSYPFCLISLCQGPQTGPSIAWGLREGNYLFIDWVDRWLRWPFCVPAWAKPSPGSSGHFGDFVSGCLSQHFPSHLTWWLSRPLSHLFVHALPLSLFTFFQFCTSWRLHPKQAYVHYSILKAIVKIVQIKDKFRVSHRSYF